MPSSSLETNGLRVVELPMSGRLATAIAIAFPGGARYEGPEEVGVAHFLEHLVFKGAEQHRTARILNRSAERLGTDLNGLTTDDYVELSAVVRAESAMPTLDLVTDIAGQALLGDEHVEAERAVILQEIADDKEDPGTVADDRLVSALFRDHRLGTPTSGGTGDVEGLTHTQLLSFRERHWSPEGGVAVLAGNLQHLDRARLTEFLARIPARPAPPPPSPIPPFARRVEIEERDSDVVHLRLAYSVPGLDLSRPRDQAVADVYSSLLGGPMGSRLFEEIRERRGLCYAIDGYVWGYRGASLLSVDCSLRPGKVPEAYEVIGSIVADLSARGPTEEESARARSYATGTGALGFESSRARADHAVELIMEYGDTDVDPLVHLRALDAVTRQDVAELAARVAPGPCVGCVGAVTPALFE